MPDNVLSRSTSSGFAASVYDKGSEVVIAFRGTDDPQWQDFWDGNIPAARGTYSQQVAEAIQLVSDAMAANPGKTITLTGHSLGGGLASLMAAFFDLTAVVFDPAPFALTAQSEYIPIVSVGVVPVPIPVPFSSTLVTQYFQSYHDRQVALGRPIDANFELYRDVFASTDDVAIGSTARRQSVSANP